VGRGWKSEKPKTEATGTAAEGDNWCYSRSGIEVLSPNRITSGRACCVLTNLFTIISDVVLKIFESGCFHIAVCERSGFAEGASLPISQWKSLRNTRHGQQHVIILNGQAETYQSEHFNTGSSRDGETDLISGQIIESRRDRGRDGVLKIYGSGWDYSKRDTERTG